MNKKNIMNKHNVYDTISMKHFAKNGIGVYKGSVCLRFKDVMTKAEQRHFFKLMKRHPRK